MNETIILACKKLDDELAEIKGDKYILAIKNDVTAVLKQFCGQNEEFSQCILQSDKKLNDCLKSVVSGIKDFMSDLEAYKRAAVFYFPTAIVEFNMKIKMSKYEGDSENTGEKTLNLNLDELLGL